MDPSYEMKREALVHSLHRDEREFQSAVASLKDLARQQVAVARDKVATVKDQWETVRNRVDNVRLEMQAGVQRLDLRPQVVARPLPWLCGALAAGFLVGMLRVRRRAA